MIVDFHRPYSDRHPTKDKVRSLKRPLIIQADQSERPRVLYIPASEMIQSVYAGQYCMQLDWNILNLIFDSSQ
jgi:hypothetical protein